MKVSFPVALSAQMALQQRLDTIANNVANARTAGFRAEVTKFETVLSRVTYKPVAFATAGETHLSQRTGPMVKTGNALDVAVRGNGWLALQGPAGTIYTRDGRMRMLPTGELQSMNGYAVLDVGGAPISLNAQGGPPSISRDGMISQGGNQIGAIGLFKMAADARLTRLDNSGVVPDREPEPVIEFTTDGIAQGFVEQSNVNAVSEVTRLIEVTRAFEALTSLMAETERTSLDAIKTLGRGS